MKRNSAKKLSFTELAKPFWSLWQPLHSTRSSFLLRRMVRNGIPRVCFYFCSTERNFRLFSLPLKSSEGNTESLLLFWFHGMEFWVVFSSAEEFGREFREFASILVPRNGFPSCFLFGFGREFREFASIFVQRNGIPSCFLSCWRVRNGIPRAFCSAEQPEFRQKSPFVPSIPSSTELFFVGNSQP